MSFLPTSKRLFAHWVALILPVVFMMLPLHLFTLGSLAGFPSSLLLYSGLAFIAASLTQQKRYACLLIVVFIVLEAAGLVYRKATGVDVPLTVPVLSFVLDNIDELGELVSTEFSPLRVLGVFLCVPALYFSLVYAVSKWVGVTQTAWSKRLSVTLGGLFLVFSFFPLFVGRPLLLNTFLYFAVSAADENDAYAEEITTGFPDGFPPLKASLIPLKKKEPPKNLVIVILESTRWRDSTLDRPELKTTPFLAGLAKQGASFSRTLTPIPHTSKSLVSILCGIDPSPSMSVVEARPNGIPARCLPSLLAPLGYKTAYFQTATEKYENRTALIENIGFEEFFPGNRLPNEDLEKANYFGFEDEILIQPAERWVSKNKNGPFLNVFLTNAAHHPYGENERLGTQAFAKKKMLNRYLNAVNYQDQFLEKLYAVYEEAGLLEETVFVVIGDHGQAFGEHQLNHHNSGIYEEFVKVPFVIVTPEKSHRLEDPKVPVTQLDVLPTVAHLLGYEIQGGKYPGVKLSNEIGTRTHFSACYTYKTCASLSTSEYKYIYNFDRKQDEYYDLTQDPGENRNLILSLTPEEKKDYRGRIKDWLAKTSTLYRRH